MNKLEEVLIEAQKTFIIEITNDYFSSHLLEKDELESINHFKNYILEQLENGKGVKK